MGGFGALSHSLAYIPTNDQISMNSACIAGKCRRRVRSDNVCSEGWLAQACHIFNSLDIKYNLDDYGGVQLTEFGILS
jgi:hypothetical protein